MVKKRKRAPKPFRSRAPKPAAERKRSQRKPTPRVQSWFQNLNREHAHELAQRFYTGQLQHGMITREEFQDKVRDRRAELQAKAREREVSYLTDAVKQLRSFYTGLAAADGYDLRHIATWPQGRVDRVRDLAEGLRGRLAREHVLARPSRYRQKARQQRFRKALKRETGELRPEAKVYVVPVPAIPGRRQAITLAPSGQLERRDYLPSGTYLVDRRWPFRDYLTPHRQPITRREFFEAAEAMLSDLPEFMYFRFWTGPRGLIGSLFRKDLLLDELGRYFDEYQSAFTETLLGVGFIGTREQAFKRSALEEQRKAKQLREKTQQGKIRRRRERAKHREHARWRRFVLQDIERAPKRKRKPSPKPTRKKKPRRSRKHK